MNVSDIKVRLLFLNYLFVFGYARLCCCRSHAPVAEWCVGFTAVASLVAAPRLSSCGAQGLSCSTACGIFPDQESNPCLLHWQENSLPLNPLSKPVLNGRWSEQASAATPAEGRAGLAGSAGLQRRPTTGCQVSPLTSRFPGEYS